MQRLEKRPTTVHVILYNGGGSTTGGANQTNIGMSVTKFTGGKFENVNSAPRASSRC